MTKPTLIRRADVENILSIGRTWIADALDPKSDRYKPEFPRPLKLEGSRTNYWVADEINAWVDDQIAIARDGGE